MLTMNISYRNEPLGINRDYAYNVPDSAIIALGQVCYWKDGNFYRRLHSLHHEFSLFEMDLLNLLSKNPKYFEKYITYFAE